MVSESLALGYLRTYLWPDEMSSRNGSVIAPQAGQARIAVYDHDKLVTPDVRAPSHSWSLSFHDDVASADGQDFHGDLCGPTD